MVSTYFGGCPGPEVWSRKSVVNLSCLNSLSHPSLSPEVPGVQESKETDHLELQRGNPVSPGCWWALSLVCLICSTECPVRLLGGRPDTRSCSLPACVPGTNQGSWPYGRCPKHLPLLLLLSAQGQLALSTKVQWSFCLLNKARKLLDPLLAGIYQFHT